MNHEMHKKRISTTGFSCLSRFSWFHYYSYDALSRLLSETNGLGLFAYTYLSNVSGRVAKVTNPNKTSANFEYHPANNERRLKKIWYDDERVPYDPVLMSSHEYEYSPVGNITSWIQKRRDHANPNQVNQNNHTFAYDPINQLTSAVQKRNNVTVNSYAYTYDKAGNRTKETVNADVRAYGYNWLNQLLGTETAANTGVIRFKGSVDKPSFVKVNGLPVYLAANNTFETFLEGVKGRNEVLVEATETLWGNMRKNTYSFNQTDDLLQLTHTYDADGNLTYDSEKKESYAWDAKNQLTKITHANGAKTEFVYDGRGRRIKVIEIDKNNNTVEKRYFWLDGNQPFEERSSTNTVLKRYFAQGEHEVNSSGAAINKVFYEKDHLGSVRGLVDNNVQVQAVYDYDPYGRRTKVSGAGDTVVSYTGHHWHEKSGLYLTWFRQYEPKTGKWLSRDPIEEFGGTNMYGYVLNNPINLLDPYGLIDIFIYGAGGINHPWSNDAITQMAKAKGTEPYRRWEKGKIKDAIRAAKAANPCEPVNITGYSRGAIAANELANQLAKEGIRVTNLTLIDPVTVSNFGRGSIDVSDNADCKNVYYQTIGEPFKGNMGNGSNVNNYPMGVGHSTIPYRVP